jgi:hypothetical protein
VQQSRSAPNSRSTLLAAAAAQACGRLAVKAQHDNSRKSVKARPSPPHIVNAAKLSDPSSVRRLMRTHLQRYTRFLDARDACEGSVRRRSQRRRERCVERGGSEWSAAPHAAAV